MIREFYKNCWDEKKEEHTLLFHLNGSAQLLEITMEEEEQTIMMGETLVSGPGKLYPDLKRVFKSSLFLSAGIAGLKAKAIDDRILATVELLSKSPLEAVINRDHFLYKTAKALMNNKMQSDKAFITIITALEFGGSEYFYYEDFPGKKEILKKAMKSKERFMKDEKRSKVMGFYTADDRLTEAFLQLRYLQQQLNRESAQMIYSVLAGNRQLLEEYKGLLALLKGLNNSFAQPTILECANPAYDSFHLIPPATSIEGRLIESKISSMESLDNINIMDELIRQLRSGEISLKPGELSGWYDFKLYSYEPFVLLEQCRESEKVSWNEEYLNYLQKLFKGLYTLTRETHLNLLDAICTGTDFDYEPKYEVTLKPNLSVEPLPEHYLRRARSYTFIKEHLLYHFGENILSRQPLHSFTEEQKNYPGNSLLNSLLEIESLFYGLYEICCLEIGLPPQRATGYRDKDALRDRAFAQSWITNLQSDGDIGGDFRCMVPLYYDEEREQHKVVLLLGFSTRKICIDYKKPPEVKITEYGKDVTKSVTVNWKNESEELLYLVTEELYVNRLLDREEFRELCDQCETKSQVIKKMGEL